MIQAEYVGREREWDMERPWFDELDVVSQGSHLYGTVLVPGRDKAEGVATRPCAILLHGYPGHIATFDVAQALRRAGIVTVSFFYRGCWGSQGYYTIPGLFDDAVAVAEWLRQPEIADRYGVDIDKVFLVGHSMGGLTAINAMRRLPWIRGTAVMAPFDLPWTLANGEEHYLKALLDSGEYVLRVESPTSLYESAIKAYQAGCGIFQAFDDLKDRNLLFIGASDDDLAPAEHMIEPLWDQLQAHETTADQAYITLDTEHTFGDKRLTVSKLFAQWMAKVSC